MNRKVDERGAGGSRPDRGLGRIGSENDRGVFSEKPGDVFNFPLDVATASAMGVALYWSSSTVLTATTGSNILAYVVGEDNYPPKQGHLSLDTSPDSGTTIATTTDKEIAFIQAASYYAALFV